VCTIRFFLLFERWYGSFFFYLKCIIEVALENYFDPLSLSNSKKKGLGRRIAMYFSKCTGLYMNFKKVSVNVTNFHKCYNLVHDDDVSYLKVWHVAPFITWHVIITYQIVTIMKVHYISTTFLRFTYQIRTFRKEHCYSTT
jgi:hypothetical protein